MDSGLDDSFTNVQTDVDSSASSRINNTHSKVTKREERALLFAVEDTDGFYDILSAVHKLKYRPDFQDKYHHLLRRVSVNGMSDRGKILSFMYSLLHFIPFDRLTFILYSVGFDIVASRITNSMLGETCREIGPAKLTDSTHLQRFFYTQKRLLDDNAFKCRKSYLESLSKNLIKVLRNSENSNAQMDVGKLAIVTWLRVQQCQRSQDINQIINDMLNELPQSVDKALPNIVFLSKLAVAFELDGDSDASDKYLSEAVSKAELYSDPLTKSLLFHDTRYVHQLRFMRLKDEETRVKVQTDCVKAISFFSAHQNDFCKFMWRILCLYLVHNLLKIGQNFEIDTSEVASSHEMTQATDVLSSLERCFQSGLPLEQRRKMIYFILRARMHEIGGEKDVAVSYLSEAYGLRDDGTFFRVEEVHLTQFKSRLDN